MHLLVFPALLLSAIDPVVAALAFLLVLVHGWLAVPRVWLQDIACRVSDQEWRLEYAPPTRRMARWHRRSLPSRFVSGRQPAPVSVLTSWRRLGPLFILGLRDPRSERTFFLPLVADSLDLAGRKALARYLTECQAPAS
ncbi:MAG: hypothetical protein ACP5DC_02995 [Halothiobacillaceae bacterium]